MLFSGRDCEVLLSPVLPRFSFLQKSCPKTCCLAYPSAAKGEEEIYLFDYSIANGKKVGNELTILFEVAIIKA